MPPDVPFLYGFTQQSGGMDMKMRGMALGIVLLTAASAHATTQTPINLADLVTTSSQIVVGTVTAVRPAHAGGLPTTEVELKVSDTLRGTAQQTLTFRTVGLSGSPTVENGRRLLGQAPGLPQYAVGENVLLFLGPTSALGLRAPVGLQLGKFALHSGSAQNGVQNRGLFTNLPLDGRTLNAREQAMVTTQQGALDTTTFVGFVRRALQEAWWTNGDGGGGQRKPGVSTPGRSIPAPGHPSRTTSGITSTLTTKEGPR